MENTNPVPQQSQDFTPVLPTPPPPAPLKKRPTKKLIFTIGILLFALTGIGIGGMRAAGLFSQNSPTPTISEPTPSLEDITPTTGETDSPATTETMKTYENSENNFSLSHPESLAPKATSYGLGVTNISLNDASGQGVYQMLVFSKTIAGMIGQNFDNYYNMAPNTKTTIKDPDGNSQEFTKIKNRTTGGQRAFDYITTSSPPNPDEESDAGTYIEIGGNILIISTGESNRDQLNRMLIDFKYPTQ